jgi:hypothetical protein
MARFIISSGFGIFYSDSNTVSSAIEQVNHGFFSKIERIKKEDFLSP